MRFAWGLRRGEEALRGVLAEQHYSADAGSTSLMELVASDLERQG